MYRLALEKGGGYVGLMGILCILGGCAEKVDVSPCVGERRRVCRPNRHNMHIGRLRGEGRCTSDGLGRVADKLGACLDRLKAGGYVGLIGIICILGGCAEMNDEW